jgi:hypothetical protein
MACANTSRFERIHRDIHTNMRQTSTVPVLLPVISCIQLAVPAVFHPGPFPTREAIHAAQQHAHQLKQLG